MKTAGVRELRERLSEYLREVKGGEAVLVMERGQVVAEIRHPASRPRGQRRSEGFGGSLSKAASVRRNEWKRVRANAFANAARAEAKRARSKKRVAERE